MDVFVYFPPDAVKGLSQVSTFGRWGNGTVYSHSVQCQFALHLL